MAKMQKRGTGSVHLRKDGRWEGRYVIGYDEKGLPKTKNVLAKTKRECQAKLKALRESIEAEQRELAPVKAGMTFGEWLDHWYQTWSKPTIRPSTQAGYENAIYKHIIPELGDIPLDRLTTNDLQQFYVRLKQGGRLLRVKKYGKGLSDRSVRLCHVICRAALEKAVRDGVLYTNPADGCKLAPKRSKEMQILTQEELQRLLIQAKAEGYYELFILELATGLRRGEILALQWEDVDFITGELRIDKQVTRVNGALTVSAPKTKSSIRTVILPASVLNVLREKNQASTSRWLFPSPVKEDSPLDPASVRKRLQLILERADCKRVRFHDLRHVFVTEALEHGMDIKTLSTVIGHVSTATTLNVYAHVTDEMQRSAAEKIDRSIGKAPPRQTKARPKQRVDQSGFQPYKGNRRKPGTGCVTRIGDHLWEGRYSPKWPDGKKRPRNICAHSEKECEKLLAEMIVEEKAKITAEKERLRAESSRA